MASLHGPKRPAAIGRPACSWTGGKTVRGRFPGERRAVGTAWIALVLAGLLLMTGVPPLLAEEAPCPSRSMNEAGVIIGYGQGSLPEGCYDPLLVIVRLGYDLENRFPRLRECKGVLSLYIEPQVNPVNGAETEIEFGVDAGVKYMHPLSGRLWGHLFASVGPHYISVVTEKQTNGFIFSDVVGAGLTWFLTEKSAILVEYRFRHLSNADTNLPNNGINCHFGTIGYTRFF
jgi:hypothetical protein